MPWDTTDIPDQTGRTAIVTGANSGLGLATATALAAAGARVICACRNVDKGRAAVAGKPGDLQVSRLDLADLSSVEEFADAVDGPVDLLINNAGVMAVPKARTADGFEMQFGTNHLGHFALTGRLLPRVTGRVVTVSSAMHRLGKIQLDDLNWERRRYQRWLAYGQTKLANLVFTYELQRRLAGSGSPVLATAAHPGYAATNLQGRTETIQDKLIAIGNRVFAQSAQMGALPTLYAAVAPHVPGGAFVGPGGFAEQRGHPKLVRSSSASHDQAVQRDLWAASEKLTGISYAFAAPSR